MNNNEAATPDDRVVRLLSQWHLGNCSAREELLTILYSDLHKLAAGYLRKERPNHTLQPTALVNEAYIKINGRSRIPVESKAHFMAAAAQAMRRILVSYARRQAAGKRIGAFDKVTLVETSSPGDTLDIDFVALDQAMDRLSDLCSRQARVVELRYFGGLNQAEVADVLGISVPTAERDWRIARMMLRRWLADRNEVR